jgi:hypothetical protein
MRLTFSGVLSVVLPPRVILVGITSRWVNWKGINLPLTLKAVVNVLTGASCANNPADTARSKKTTIAFFIINPPELTRVNAYGKHNPFVEIFFTL